MARGRGRFSSPFSSFSRVYFYIIFLVASTFIAHTLLLHCNAEVGSIQTLHFGGDSFPHSPEILGPNFGEMDEEFKIYMYPEEDLDIILVKNYEDLMRIYAMEQYFFKKLRNSKVLTDNPDKADLFFIPISCQRVKFWNATQASVVARIKDYFRSLMYNYPYWNRTLGADHFYITCPYDLGLLNTGNTPSLAKLMPREDILLPKAPLQLPCPPEEHQLDEINALELNREWEFDVQKINVGVKYCISDDDRLHARILECINNGSYDFVIFSSNTHNAIQSQLLKLFDHTGESPFSHT